MNVIAKRENWKIVGWAFLGLLVIGGIFAWNRRQDSAYAAEIAKWKVQKRFDDSVVKIRLDSSYQAGLANAQSIRIYLEGKTRIIRSTAGTPAEQAVAACFALADERISKCEASRKADSLTIVALRKDLATTEAKPEKQLPRYQPYAEALFDVAHQVPVIRAGATAKVFGPIDLSVAGEYAAPQAGKSDPAFRALAGIRVRF